MLNEIWKPIKGYEGLYEVSNYGNVRSCVQTVHRRIGILKPHKKNGYLAITLYKNKNYKHFYIHRVVAEHFIPNSKHLKEVNHIDCDKENNYVENLEWCNRKYNLKHSYDNGLKRQGEDHGAQIN